MEGVIPSAGFRTLFDFEGGLKTIAAEYHQKIVGLCYELLDFEHDRILVNDPSPEEKKQYEETLKALVDLVPFLARFSKMTDQPNAVTEELEWLSDRLRMSWEMVNNPMSADEADAFLAKLFPE